MLAVVSVVFVLVEVVVADVVLCLFVFISFDKIVNASHTQAPT